MMLRGCRDWLAPAFSSVAETASCRQHRIASHRIAQQRSHGSPAHLLDERQHQGKGGQAKDSCDDGKQLAGPAGLLLWQVLPAQGHSMRSGVPSGVMWVLSQTAAAGVMARCKHGGPCRG